MPSNAHRCHFTAPELAKIYHDWRAANEEYASEPAILHAHYLKTLAKDVVLVGSWQAILAGSASLYCAHCKYKVECHCLTKGYDAMMMDAVHRSSDSTRFRPDLDEADQRKRREKERAQQRSRYHHSMAQGLVLSPSMQRLAILGHLDEAHRLYFATGEWFRTPDFPWQRIALDTLEDLDRHGFKTTQSTLSCMLLFVRGGMAPEYGKNGDQHKERRQRQMRLLQDILM